MKDLSIAAPRRVPATLVALFAVTACALVALAVSAQNANAAYNILDFQLKPSTLQAGGHPNTHYHVDPDAKLADTTGGDDLKTVVVDFPAGFLGNPEAATTKCTDAQFNGSTCPSASVIGTMKVQMRFTNGSTLTAPGTVYVLTPPAPGAAASIGFAVRPNGYRAIYLKNVVTGVVGVRTGADADYGLTLTVDNIPRTLTTTRNVVVNATIADISVDITARAGSTAKGPYFTFNPTRCTPAIARATLTSYAGVVVSKSNSFNFTPTGCANVPFNPTGSVTPSTLVSGAPAGWKATFSVPTADATIQNSHVKDVQVDLPNGTNLDFPAINAIPATCNDAALNADTCPAGSKIGSASVNVPFLPPTMTGDIYLMFRGVAVTFGYVLRGANGIKVMQKGTLGVVDIDGDGSADLVRGKTTGMPQAPWSTATLDFSKPLATNPCLPNPNGTVKSVLTGWSGASKTINTPVTFSGVCETPPPPTVTITTPPQGFVTPNPSIVVSYIVSDPTATCSIPNNSSVPLNLGQNVITVSCANASGVGMASVNGTRTGPLTVDIVSPPDNLWTSSSSIPPLTIAVSGGSGSYSCTIRINNGTPTPYPGPIAGGLVEGANTITITCTDSAGNIGSDTITIRRDTVAPFVTITTPPNNSNVTPGPRPVAWVATDVQDPTPANNCTVSVNGVVQPGAPHTSPLTVQINEGGNTITVTCRDEAGNAGSSTVTVIGVIIDDFIVFQSPANNSWTTAATTTVAWTGGGSGQPGTICTVRNNGTVAAGAPHVSPVTIPLVNGVNTIQVTCTNSAGESMVGSVTVRRDNIAPTVVISSPAAGTPITIPNATFTVTWSTTDDQSPTPGSNCVVRNNGVIVASPAPPHTSPATVSITNGSASNSVTVTCTDLAGNAGVGTVVLGHFDNFGPTITSPINGSWTTASTTNVSFTINGVATIPPGTACAISVNNGAQTAVGSASSNPVPLVVGANTIVVTCTNPGGSMPSQPVTVRRDNSPPVMAITSPANGSTVPTGPVTVAWTVTDDQDPTPGNNCTVRVDGAPVAGGPHISPITIPPLPPGSHTITITCVDEAGNVASATITITVPAPNVLNITSPVNGSTTTAPAVNVAYTINGASSIPAGTTCSISRNGGPAQASTSPTTNTVAITPGTNQIVVTCVNASGSFGNTVTVFGGGETMPIVTLGSLPAWTTGSTLSVSWTVDPVTSACTVSNNGTNIAGAPHTSPVSVPLAVGANTLRVTCVNSAGDTGSSTVTVRRDTQPPVVTITSPSNGSSLPAGTTSVAVAWTVTDDQDPTPANNCTLRNNGTAVAGAPHTSPTTAPAINGANAISVTCIDEAGNSGVSTVTLLPPPIVTVVITMPVNNSWTTASTTNVAYTVNGSSSIPAGTTCSITNNGGSPQASTSTTTNSVNLVSGANTIQVSCTNSGGSGTSNPVTVRRDVPPPAVTISPVLPAWTTASSISVAWSVLDDQDPTPANNCTLRVNGTALAGAPHTSPMTAPLANGPNGITVTCLDEAGNSGVATATVRRDNATPVVNITSPANGAFVPSGTTSISVTWAATDDQDPTPASNCTLSSNGTNVAGAPHASPTTAPLVAGSNTLTVRCLDEAGNAGNSVPVTVTVSPPPSFVVTSPVNGSWTSASTTNVAYTLSGGPSIPPGTTCTITVNGGSPISSTSATTNNIALVNGVNVITVSCTNASGSASASTTIRRDTTPPVVTITSPSGPLPGGTTSVSVAWTVVDDQDPTPANNCIVRINGTAVAGAPHTSPTTAPLVNGPNTISVTCVDEAGNSGVATATMTQA